MPVIRPEPQPIVGTCDECGVHAIFEELDEDGEESAPPADWVHITLRRTVRNPDYVEEVENQAAFVEHGIAQLREAYTAQGATLSKELEAQARVEYAAQATPQSTPYTLQEMEALLCPKHAILLQTRLGLDEWPALDDDLEDEGDDEEDEG